MEIFLVAPFVVLPVIIAENNHKSTFCEREATPSPFSEGLQL